MIEMTVQVPDRLAERLRPLFPWLPAVLELGLVGFKTPAVQTASEIIAFCLPVPLRPKWQLILSPNGHSSDCAAC